jgi:hypothetical protein
MPPCESCKVNETPVIQRIEDKKVQRLLEILAKKMAQAGQSGTSPQRAA